MKKFFLSLVILSSVLMAIYHIRIGTGRYCSESPEVRWKFAVYAGECTDLNDGNDCHFYKIKDTGLMEYLGLRQSKLQKQQCYNINIQ